MKVQCICPIGIGNYLMCYPAFHFLKKKKPDCSLHLIALRHSIGALAQGDPLWDSIETFDPDKIKRDVKKGISIIARLRAMHCDASLCFFPSNTWQYFSVPFLSGISRRYAFKYDKKKFSSLSFLCNNPLKVDLGLHDIDQNIKLVEFFLQENYTEAQKVFPKQYDDADLAWATAYCESEAPGKRRIAVHPGSSVEHGMDVKRWSADRFGLLCDKICKKMSAHAFVLGSPDEDELKRAMAQSMKENAHIVETVSIKKTAALLSQCSLALCNDSGIMHMAACLDIPTIGIFGPTDEKRNGPYGKKNIVVRKPMQGFPLWTAANVGDRGIAIGIDPKASLNALTVDDAWDQIEPWLEKIVCN